MKTLKYIVLAILLGINLVSCDPPTINEEVGIEIVDVKGNDGGDNEIDEGDD